MKLPTSDKTSSFGNKPYVKKGYYPGKLLKVELYTDKEGIPKVGNYGRQLIFEFAVYKADENDAPIAPMTFVPNEGDDPLPVRIPKFVYHEYKNQKKKHEDEPDFHTAITPNSAITKTLKALGWKFSADGVDPDEFVGNWVELNIDDYVQKNKEGDEYTASTIKDINPYTGPKVGDIEDVEASKKPETVEKQIKQPKIEETEVVGEKAKIEARIKKLEDLFKDGLVSEDGYKQGVEKLKADIEELNR